MLQSGSVHGVGSFLGSSWLAQVVEGSSDTVALVSTGSRDVLRGEIIKGMLRSGCEVRRERYIEE